LLVHEEVWILVCMSI